MSELEDVILAHMKTWAHPVSPWEVTEKFRLLGMPTTGIKNAMKQLAREGQIKIDRTDNDRSSPADFNPARYRLS